MKKLFAMLLVLIMALSAAAMAVEPGKLSEEKITFTAFATIPSNTLYTDDLANNEFTKYFEELTNVHIDWTNLTYGASGDDQVTKLNIMLAGGSYPDLILTNSFSKIALYQTAQDGILIDMKPLIKDYAPNLAAIFEQRPDIEAQWTAPDGGIYGLGAITEYYHGEAPNRVWANTDWLEKLDMELPTTTDEFYDMLVAFKENDMNGNGEADEIPLITMDYATKVWLISSWIYFDGSNLMVEDDEVKFVSNTEEYKEAVTYIHKLYEEGLIPVDVFTADSSTYNANMNATPEVVGASAYFWQGVFADWTEDNSRGTHYAPVRPLDNPDGEAPEYPKGLFDSTPNRFSITTSCKYPEIAMQWVDALYDYDFTHTAHYGPQLDGPNTEEFGWWQLEPGLNMTNQLSVDHPNYRNNVAWGLHIAVFYMPATEADIRTRMDGTRGWTEAQLAASSALYEPYKTMKSVPNFFMTSDGAQKLSEYRVGINSTVDKYFAAFVTGAKDIETEWDAYLAELEANGLEEYLEIYQAEYDYGVLGK